MTNQIKSVLSISLVLLLLFAGCGSAPSPLASSEDAHSSLPTSNDAPSTQSADTSLSENVESESENSQEETVTLYIGWGDDFKAIEYTGKGQEISPEILIAAIAETTGWDLSLSGDVINEKNSMVVSFAPECALFTGPPDPQKEEFHVFDVDSLTFSIFDSISETLKKHFSPDDTDALNVYFCGEDNAPLVLPNIGLGVTLPTDSPYSHAKLEALIAKSYEATEDVLAEDEMP